MDTHSSNLNLEILRLINYNGTEGNTNRRQIMRKIFTLNYLVLPSLLVSSAYLNPILIPSDLFMLQMGLVYIITLIHVILFFILKPCRERILFLGLALSPLLSSGYTLLALIVFLSRGDGLYAAIWQFNLLFVIIAVVFYVLPFIYISVLLRGFCRLRQERKQGNGIEISWIPFCY